MDEKCKKLDTVRYHWSSYVARGGFNKSVTNPHDLQKGGLEHWNMFLILGREYLSLYPKDRYILEGFLPEGMIKLLTGEEHDTGRTRSSKS